MPDFVTSHYDPLTGEDDTFDQDASSLGLVTTRIPQMQFAPSTDVGLGDPDELEGKVSRNAPCPCGSGRKYKHCHGAL